MIDALRLFEIKYSKYFKNYPTLYLFQTLYIQKGLLKYLLPGSHGRMEQEIAYLYEKLNTELIKWCLMMTQDEDMAREIVQEGFLRAIDHYGDICGQDFNRQRAWFYRTVKNIYIDTWRKRKNESLTADVTEDFFWDRYSEADIMCLIESMDVLEGKILVLRYFDGYSSKQIGQLLNLPPGTVRSKLHEARKHLKDML